MTKEQQQVFDELDKVLDKYRGEGKETFMWSLFGGDTNNFENWVRKVKYKANSTYEGVVQREAAKGMRERRKADEEKRKAESAERVRQRREEENEKLVEAALQREKEDKALEEYRKKQKE